MSKAQQRYEAITSGRNYSLMVHFLVSMMHQHKLPQAGYATLGDFASHHANTIASIVDAAGVHYGYAISPSQIGEAIEIYLRPNASAKAL